MSAPPPSDRARQGGEGGLVAVTGASGFVGSHSLPALAARDLRLRILTRRDPVHELWRGLDLEAVPGDIDDTQALTRLVAGADVVVHGAGLVKAATRQDFLRVNRDGTHRLVEAMRQHAPAAHLVLVSSLAAREPTVSAYAASKRAGEEAAAAFAAGPGRLTILRPAAVYGPGDRETLAIFRAARLPRIPLAGAVGGKVAMLHVGDLAAAISAVAASADGPSPALYELADGKPDGYAFEAVAGQAALAQERTARFLRLPASILRAAGLAADLMGFLSGRPSAFGSGKTREMLHPDWSVRPEALPPAALWHPRVSLDQGFADTVRWYRARGWLAP